MSAKYTFILAVGIAILFATAGYLLLGPIAAAIFSVFLIGSLIIWRLTTYGHPVDPRPIVIPYLLTIIFFTIHVGEEYFTKFWIALSGLTGQSIPEQNYFLVAALIGPIFWLTGLILLYLRTEIGNWLAWAFVVAMTVSELAHFVFPFLGNQPVGYFSGLYTAALPLIPAWFVAIRLYRDSREQHKSLIKPKKAI